MGERADREGRLTRRRLLVAGAVLPVLPLQPEAPAGPPAASRRAAATTAVRGRSHQAMHVAVIGAGAFGGWTALMLRRAGVRVTLVDAWGPGHSRASSGGETRVIRHTYGPHRIYTEWVLRSLEMWRAAEREWGEPLYRETGVLWMVQDDASLVEPALPILRDLGVAHERLEPSELARRYPALALEGVRWALWEPNAGYLWARDNCARVVDALVRQGGEFLQAWASPGDLGADGLRELRLADGGTLAADAFVFACGPWLGRLFPEVIGDRVKPTRQEVYFFGHGPGDDPFAEGRFPVWADQGERLWYGVPGSGRRGFKIADDTIGREVDPTTQERIPDADGIGRARAYLARRFPSLAEAPLVESRVCQYEVSPDGDFIIDRHPEADNVWLVGGGSGHGYKHGPALGEHVAACVTGAVRPIDKFSLARFAVG